MPKQFSFALLMCAALAAPLGAVAQETDTIIENLTKAAESDEQLLHALRQLERDVRERGRYDSHLRSYLSQLYQMAPNGRLTKADVDMRVAAETARRRASSIGQLLAWDLNGDAVIAADERELVSGHQAADIELLFLRGDTDGDGKISIEEIIAHVNKANADNNRHRNHIYAMLLAMDANGDGTVTSQDIVATLDAVAAQPLNLQQQINRRAVLRDKPKQACTAPAVPDSSKLMVLSAYEGGALSSVAVAGMDSSTQVARVDIEQGDSPIYLFLTSYENLIWEITGATDRISHVVVQKTRSKGGAGVTGVARDKVHFTEGEACMKAVWDIEGGKGIIAYREAERSFKRAPDNMVAHYTITQIALPSGKGVKEGGEGRDIIIYNGRRFEMTPEGPKPIDEAENQPPGDRPFGATRVFQSLKRFHPAGLREIDPEAVVADGEAQTYDVLPQEAGLLQLLLDGRLQYTRDGFFIVTEEIPRFPADLSGAHGVKFMLAEGVPMPGGSPGHSSVYSAETGECVTRHCR